MYRTILWVERVAFGAFDPNNTVHELTWLPVPNPAPTSTTRTIHEKSIYVSMYDSQSPTLPQIGAYLPPVYVCGDTLCDCEAYRVRSSNRGKKQWSVPWRTTDGLWWKVGRISSTNW